MNEQKVKEQKDGFVVLYEAENIVIRWYEQWEIMEAYWRGVQYEAELRLAGEKMLEFLKERKCSKVLNDNTKVEGPWHHSADWANADWFPRMEKAGLKYFAWICPGDFLSHLSAQRAVPGGTLVKPFLDYDEALTWLLKMH